MTAKSLLRKLKQLFGRSDRSGSDSGSRHASAEETDVTVEREPEQDSEIDPGESTPTDQTETQTGTGDSVEKIKGIGPTYRDRLEDGDIGTITQLASSDAETVAEVAETSEGRAAEWIKRANSW